MKMVLVTQGSWTEEVTRILRREGASVVRLPSDVRETDALDVLKHATHLLLTGGADIHPVLYNEDVTHARSTPTAAVRDLIEWSLTRAALDAKKPVLGICRGCQMLAVATGGALWQDVKVAVPESKVAHGTGQHVALTYAKTLYARIVRTERADVNSYHHQAVRRLVKGWQLGAVAPDGIVEAIEHKHQWALGVQYHPEVLNSPVADRIFEAFVAAR